MAPKLFYEQSHSTTAEPVVLNESKETIFHQARPVSCALQKKVESALLKMDKDGVRENVLILILLVMHLL